MRSWMIKDTGQEKRAHVTAKGKNAPLSVVECSGNRGARLLGALEIFPRHEVCVCQALQRRNGGQRKGGPWRCHVRQRLCVAPSSTPRACKQPLCTSSSGNMKRIDSQQFSANTGKRNEHGHEKQRQRLSEVPQELQTATTASSSFSQQHSMHLQTASTTTSKTPRACKQPHRQPAVPGT